MTKHYPLLISSILISLSPSLSFAIKMDNCWNEVRHWEFLGISSSTTSFVSSIGDCAAVAQDPKKGEILQFVTVNSESLEKDLARKSGEYLSSLQELAALNARQVSHLISSPKAQQLLSSKNYDHFYHLLLNL